MTEQESSINISHIAYPVTSLGPGNRLVLWVTGCPFSCTGCITPELQQKQYGKVISIKKLAKKINLIAKNSSQPITGITFTGGEPFAQAEELWLLWSLLKVTLSHWDVLIFSGYSYRYLHQHKPEKKLLTITDILIDGTYNDMLAQTNNSNNQHPLIASKNQQIYYLSNKGKKLQNDCEDLARQSANLGFTQGHTAWLIGIINHQERQNFHTIIKN